MNSRQKKKLAKRYGYKNRKNIKIKLRMFNDILTELYKDVVPELVWRKNPKSGA